MKTVFSAHGQVRGGVLWVALANGCVLEMRRSVADGVETGGRLIRYAGPAGVADVLHNPPIDVELNRSVHIG